MVGPRLIMMMDEISTGLDSSTTFQMVQSLRHMAHLQRATICVALLQPAPEVFDLFDDIMVLADGAFDRLQNPSALRLTFHHACVLKLLHRLIRDSCIVILVDADWAGL